MTEIIDAHKIDKKTLDSVVDAIRNGAILLYPTDTVYGIGGDATSEEVVSKVYKIKKRDYAKPLSVAFADFVMLSEYCAISGEQEELLKRCLPGPYTFIMKIKKRIAATPSDRLGVRIPENDLVRMLIEKSGKPLITTSANLSGGKDAFDFAEVDKSVIDACDIAINAGSTKYRKPSTVVDLINKRILREGAGKTKVF